MTKGHDMEIQVVWDIHGRRAIAAIQAGQMNSILGADGDHRHQKGRRRPAELLLPAELAGYLGAPQLPQNLIPAATRVPHLVHGEGEEWSGAVRGASCGEGAGACAC